MAIQITEDVQPGWQRKHAQRYAETAGEDGYLWNGAPTLLLTTTGRKSGEQRTTPLIFGRDGDRYVVVGSRGGSPKHAKWFLNLQADPEVTLQVKADRFRARARVATEAEKADLWQIMTAIWPAYDDYKQRTKRTIPVVIFERI